MMKWVYVTLLGLAVTQPVAAEIYKWKDKDGVVRYTDTPPPNHIKPITVTGGKKPAKPTENAAPPAADASTANSAPNQATGDKPPKTPEEAAAEQRRIKAEMDKRDKTMKEERAKQREANCKAAKADYETYKQGGRIYKTDENGERKYLGDKDMDEGAQKAQNDINEYCN